MHVAELQGFYCRMSCHDVCPRTCSFFCNGQLLLEGSAVGFATRLSQFLFYIVTKVSQMTTEMYEKVQTLSGTLWHKHKGGKSNVSVCCLCLLPGEIVVNEVNFVRKCISAENSPDDLYGKLICTNFKVSFIPQDAPAKQVASDFNAVTTRPLAFD